MKRLFITFSILLSWFAVLTLDFPVIAGPREYQKVASGRGKAVGCTTEVFNNLTASGATGAVGSDNRQRRGGSFTTVGAYTTCTIKCVVNKVGNPTTNLEAWIYADNAGVPLTGATGLSQSSTTVTPAEVGTGTTLTFVFNYALSATTRYHFVLYSANNDASNYYQLVYSAAGSEIISSASTTAFTANDSSSTPAIAVYQ